MKKESVIVAPHVGRITEGLRDTGYNLDTAIADLVDNSIAAGAGFIDVRMGLNDQGEALVAIGDNGHGMDDATLIECMRYGSPSQDETQRLGKFGLGLKTASTAFCRRLVVASRTKERGKSRQAVWDLDTLAETGKWTLELGKPGKEVQHYLDLCTDKGAGTVVVWQKIDRLLAAEIEPAKQGFPVSPKEEPKDRLERIIKKLGDHLALVFQRYLDPDCRDVSTIQLYLNEERVLPWNPFLPQQASSCGTQILTVTIHDNMAPITISASILPRPETLDETTRAHANIDSAHQGIYIYRENRLIHGPGWLGIHDQDPKWSLLRVSLSFPAPIDEIFMVDIKKSRVLINENLFAWLKDVYLPPLLQRAEERWKQGAAENTKQSAAERHSASNNTINSHLSDLTKAQVLDISPNSGETLLRNHSGEQKISLPVFPNDFGLPHIHLQAQSSDENLWQPALVDGTLAVSLNTGHPFYAKVYMPNEKNSPLVQGLDALFWSLAQAEANNLNPENQACFSAMRAEIARNLAKLVEGLPGPQ